MVMDSFTVSHAEREKEGSDGSKCPGSKYDRPARIIAYQYYVEQNSNDHSKSDTYGSMIEGVIHDKANVVSVAQNLREMFTREKKADWVSEVKPYLECVYDVK